ncbi:L,D-transpeptidase family protein [Dendrosporobacter sp. 1207_IL3150]|uniref:L,D-transpeptidase family protein n=1 Tax=Dendrosporobacter sp. 1207_IL3150 TaxID=3084054 RepID=UPI002FDA2EC9
MKIRTLYLPHRMSEVYLKEDDCHPLVMSVQKLLTERGLYTSNIHSNYDASTRDAVTQFQELEGLPATGLIDPVTYCRLNSASISQIETKIAEQRATNALARANILITKSARTITLFNGNSPLRHYPIAIGKPSTPTPVGNYAIATKVMNPGGVLGTRWMGLNYDAYGIHGTSKPWLIGQMVSNGCIRMHNSNVEELFVLINVGCPVYIRD